MKWVIGAKISLNYRKKRYLLEAKFYPKITVYEPR